MKGIVLAIIFMMYSINPADGDTVTAHGVLDRMEDNEQAVILIEDLGEELIVPRQDLPLGSKANMWFLIEKNNEGKLERISIDYKTTMEEAEKMKRLGEKVRNK
ncbi:MAG TPA: DUF3006 domain-containing protein [Virgibacillus sp.]|nr:DUF3006 domain-containing protein [Virgibacillus sp.]